MKIKFSLYSISLGKCTKGSLADVWQVLMCLRVIDIKPDTYF